MNGTTICLCTMLKMKVFYIKLKRSDILGIYPKVYYITVLGNKNVYSSSMENSDDVHKLYSFSLSRLNYQYYM